MSEEEKVEYLRGVVTPLLDWYAENQRILPWREDPSPYRVWISEIMLQQTRVEAGRAYFERFVAIISNIRALANVEDQILMKLWEGLGYYNRARNLKKAAGVVVEKYGGELPNSFEELLELPGIGPYTAGAVASIAFGIPVPAVDGNVLRVVSRILEQRDDIAKPAVKKAMEEVVGAIIPKERPGDFNQALMELGAVVCLPNGAPKCSVCPVAELCRARRSGVTGEIPVKKAKKERRVEEKTMLILLDERGRMALRRRPSKGLLSGLWELPSFEGLLEEGEVRKRLEAAGLRCGEIQQTQGAKHIFSHVEWRMAGFTACIEMMAPVSELNPGLEDDGVLSAPFGNDAGGTGNLQAAEERVIYLKDVEAARERRIQELEAAGEAGELQADSLIFASGKELAEIYALPSAFRGFGAYFPK